MEKEIDITKHSFVPKHVKLDDNEKEEMLKKFNVSLKQLPRISRKDPAIKHLQLKSGDVLKITRKSPTAGEAVYYRVIAHE